MCKAAALSAVAPTLLASLSCLGLKLLSAEAATTKNQIFPTFRSSGPVFTIAITTLCISGFKTGAGLDHKPRSCAVKCAESHYSHGLRKTYCTFLKSQDFI